MELHKSIIGVAIDEIETRQIDRDILDVSIRIDQGTKIRLERFRVKSPYRIERSFKHEEWTYILCIYLRHENKYKLLLEQYIQKSWKFYYNLT